MGVLAYFVFSFRTCTITEKKRRTLKIHTSESNGYCTASSEEDKTLTLVASGTILPTWLFENPQPSLCKCLFLRLFYQQHISFHLVLFVSKYIMSFDPMFHINGNNFTLKCQLLLLNGKGGEKARP